MATALLRPNQKATVRSVSSKDLAPNKAVPKKMMIKKRKEQAQTDQEQKDAQKKTTGGWEMSARDALSIDFVDSEL